MMQSLVPGRECGDCNVCCSHYSIDQPDLKKPAYLLCPNWNAQGHCAVYDHRPQPCRTFYCVWRKAASLDDWWRPDRCGVALRETQEDIPADFPGRAGLAIDLLAGDAVLRDPRFILAIASQIAGGVPVVLVVPGRHGSGRVFLNHRLADGVTRRDLDAMRREMEQAAAEARAVAI